MNEPFTSIIIPVYNAELTIEKCLKSVLKQSYQNYEVIVIDDCSADNSLSIIKEFKSKFRRFRILSNPQNSGASITRNNGIKLAKGKYIAFLDSDCYPVATWLQEGVDFMEKEKDISAIGGNVYYYKRNILSALYHITMLGGQKKKKIIKKNRLGSLNVLIRKNVLDSTDKWFDHDLKRSHDVEFFFRLNQEGNNFVNVPDFAVFHDHPVQTVKDYFNFIKKEAIGYVETRKLIPLLPYNVIKSKILLILFFPLLPIGSTMKKILNGHEKSLVPILLLLIPILFVGQIYFWSYVIKVILTR